MEADDIKISALLKESFFYIPAYQRQYSWKVGECKKLWQDLVFQLEDASGLSHYMGSIVLKKSNPEGSKLAIYEVIDGQQRLTTLTILLAALLFYVKELKQPDEELTTLYEDLLFNDPKLLRSLSDRQKEKLSNKLEHLAGDRDFYSTLMRSPNRVDNLVKKTISRADNKMFVAYRFFHTILEKYLGETKFERTGTSANVKLDKLHDILRDQLNVVVITLDFKDNVQRIFETLNNRGSALQEKDLIKNLLMMSYPSSLEDSSLLYTKYWHKFEGEAWEASSGTSEVDKLSHFLYIYMAQTQYPRRVLEAKKLSEAYEDVVKRTLLKDLPNDVTAPDYGIKLKLLRENYDKFIEELHLASTWYMSKNVFQLDKREDEFLERVTAAEPSMWVPALWLHRHKQQIESKDLSLVYDLLENWIILRKMGRLSNSKQGIELTLMQILFTWLSKINSIGHLPLNETLIDWIKEQHAAFTRQPTLEELKGSFLKQIDPKFGKMLLLALEDIDNKATTITPYNQRGSRVLRDVAFITVEHLMPQTWETNWPLDANATNEERTKRATKIQTLGNLVLLDSITNSMISNNSWANKVQALQGYQKILSLKTLVMDNPLIWDETTIDARSEALQRKVLLLWPRF